MLFGKKISHYPKFKSRGHNPFKDYVIPKSTKPGSIIGVLWLLLVNTNQLVTHNTNVIDVKYIYYL